MFITLHHPQQGEKLINLSQVGHIEANAGGSILFIHGKPLHVKEPPHEILKMVTHQGAPQAEPEEKPKRGRPAKAAKKETTEDA